MAGNRTRINCLEGNYADHYTTIAAERRVEILVLLEEKIATSAISRKIKSYPTRQKVKKSLDIGFLDGKKYEKEVNLKDNIFRQPGDDQSQLAAPVHEHDTYTSTAQLNHIIGNWAIQCPCHRQ
ncbi:unnamed protein product [Spodoptera exigua]|nr:unnamed protein product [Spodoptera exigua]